MQSFVVLCFGAILFATCHTAVESGETERIVSIGSNNSNDTSSQRVHRKRIRVIKPPDIIGADGSFSNQDQGLRWVPYDMPGVENFKLPPPANHNRFSVESLYMSPANYGKVEKPSSQSNGYSPMPPQQPSKPYQKPQVGYQPKPQYGQATQRPTMTPSPPVTMPTPTTTTTPIFTTHFPPTAPTITNRPPTTPFPILNPETSTVFITFPPPTTTSRPLPPPPMTTTSTSAPPPRPQPTSTSRPTTPIRPPPSTLTPIFVPTFSPDTTTEAPNIGTEGPDDLRFRKGRQFRAPPPTPLIEVRSHEHFDPKYTELSPPAAPPKNRVAAGGHSMRQADVVNEYEFSIKCWKTRRGEYFRAEVRIAPGTKHSQPYVKDQPYNPMTSDVCKLETLGRESSAYRILITDFAACGVKRCNNTNYCLDLVIPRMPGIALLEDEIVRLQCELQKSTVAETKTYGMTSADAMARPTTSTVLGEKSAFIAELVVFKPELKGGIPNQRVDRGGAVHMGEKLEIRTVIRDNDGWRYSRLTDVVIWRSKKRSAPGQVAAPDEMIQLVDSNGCLIPGVEEIAKHPPFQDEKNLLVNRFLFRAFAFKGQEKDEPLVVTGTVQACLEAEECEVRACERPQRNPYYDGPSRSSTSRYRRSVPDFTHHHNGTKILEATASSSFLVLPKDVLEYTTESYGKAAMSNPLELPDLTPKELGLLLLATAVLTMLLTGSICCAWFYRCGRRCSHQGQQGHDLEAKSAEPRPQQHQSLLAPSLVQTSEAPYAADFRLSTEKYPKNDMSVIGYGNNGSEYHQRNSYRHQMSPQPPPGGDPRWRKHNNNNNNEEGVYVVYCCNSNDDALSSKSAPSSLRNRSRSAPRSRYAYQCGEESDESDLHPMSERIRNPRTVRSVKRSQKSRGTRIRRRLSSIYREVYGSRSTKALNEKQRKPTTPELDKDRLRHLKKKLERAGYHGTVSSEGSSEFDSAYSGGSRKANPMETEEGCGSGTKSSLGDSTVGSGPTNLTNVKSTYGTTGESVKKNHRVLVLPATDV